MSAVIDPEEDETTIDPGYEEEEDWTVEDDDWPCWEDDEEDDGEW